MCVFFLLLFIFAPSLQLEDAVHFRLLFCSLHVWTQILAVGNRPASSSSSMRNDCFRKLCWNIYEMLQQSLRNSADLRVFVNFLKLSQSLRKHSSNTINEHECGRSALCARIPRMCFHLSHVFGVSLCDSLLCGFQRWMVDWNDTRVTDENILECIKWGQIILFIHL